MKSPFSYGKSPLNHHFPMATPYVNHRISRISSRIPHADPSPRPRGAQFQCRGCRTTRLGGAALSGPWGARTEDVVIGIL